MHASGAAASVLLGALVCIMPRLTTLEAHHSFQPSKCSNTNTDIAHSSKRKQSALLTLCLLVILGPVVLRALAFATTLFATSLGIVLAFILVLALYNE